MLKRTKNITLVVLTAFAAACDENKPNPNEEIKHCVDQDGVVQDEEKCKDVPENQQPPPAPQPLPDGGTAPHSTSTTGGSHGFFWYYGGGGSSGTRYTPGSRVTGGSYTPSPGKVYSPPSRVSSPPSISRGGFGGTGGGHVGGGSAGS